MNRLKVLCTAFCLLCAMVIFAPIVGALPDNTVSSGSQNQVIQDNAELLSSLKTHVAYIGKLQQARMDGVIQYINQISEGTGTANLQQIQEDYLIAAFSVPVMRTVDEINAARDEMRQQSILFADETSTQMAMFIGTTDEMRATANSNMKTIEGPFNSVMYSSWLASETTRSTVFNQSSQRRSGILDKLSAQGIDTSQAQNLSEQIDVQQSEMENALLQNRDGALQPINSALKQLNQQVRNAVEEYQTNALIQVKTADMMAMM